MRIIWKKVPSRIETVTIKVAVVVQSLSCVWLFVAPWTAAHQASLSFTISQSLLKLMSTESVMPSNHLTPLLPSSPPALSLSQGLFQWVSSSHQVAKVLELQFQHHRSFQGIVTVDFPKDWLVWCPCYPRDSQESSPASQFESINSLALSLLYGPALTPIHDHWKNHSFDDMDLCWQRNVSSF